MPLRDSVLDTLRRVRHWRRILLPPAAAGLLVALTGCTLLLRDTPAPIATRRMPVSTGAQTATLVVFLPGRSDSIEDFERHGFVSALRAAGVNADTVAVDAHLNYYFKRTIVDRLHEDVIQPARSRGARRIVVVGVSLGGLGALLYEREHPGAIDAIVLLAPYLGDQAALFEKIRKAGGAAQWAAGRDPKSGEVEEQLWTFLGQRSTTLPPTWLLAGDRDSLRAGHQLLATLLPRDRVTFVAGAHNWKTWQSLWTALCRDSDLFAAEKAASRRLLQDRSAKTTP